MVGVLGSLKTDYRLMTRGAEMFDYDGWVDILNDLCQGYGSNSFAIILPDGLIVSVDGEFLMRHIEEK